MTNVDNALRILEENNVSQCNVNTNNLPIVCVDSNMYAYLSGFYQHE